MAPAAQAHEFSGARAMDYARKAVAFGPRPPGSAALRNLRAYIVAQLKPCGCEVTQDSFTGHTRRSVRLPWSMSSRAFRVSPAAP
jgi:hypothetical protein